jgi:hypothetical protein
MMETQWQDRFWKITMGTLTKSYGSLVQFSLGLTGNWEVVYQKDFEVKIKK